MIAVLALTASLAAQAQFNRGLTELYAYAGPFAVAQFEAAAAADPHFGVAYALEALAEGSDLNNPIDAYRFSRAQSAAAKAEALRPYASASDAAFIDAVAARYAGRFIDYPSDTAAYRGALKDYLDAYPADDDVTMLLVEAMLEDQAMEWNDDGTPLGKTSADELRLTQRVLTRSPQHLMANHLCIHLYDKAPNATPAIPCAQRLDAMTFAPEQEHLAHMPAHTWIELGDGRAAVASSERAWALHPTRYAEHDAYIGLAAAMLCGDPAAIDRWTQRYIEASHRAVVMAPPERVAQAHDLEANGKIDEALNLLQAAAVYEAGFNEMISLYPADVRIGAVYYRAARYADAKDAFADVLAHHPRDPRALFGMALTLRALGDSAGFAQNEALFKRYWAGGTLTIDDF
jgi:hypothetical protein